MAKTANLPFYKLISDTNKLMEINFELTPDQVSKKPELFVFVKEFGFQMVAVADKESLYQRN